MKKLINSLLKYFDHFLVLIFRLAKGKFKIRSVSIIELKGITNHPNLTASITLQNTRAQNIFFFTNSHVGIVTKTDHIWGDKIHFLK